MRIALIAIVLIAGAAAVVALPGPRPRFVIRRRQRFATPEGALFARLMGPS